MTFTLETKNSATSSTEVKNSAFLLQENNDFLLTESGDKIVLEGGNANLVSYPLEAKNNSTTTYEPRN